MSREDKGRGLLSLWLVAIHDKNFPIYGIQVLNRAVCLILSANLTKAANITVIGSFFFFGFAKFLCKPDNTTCTNWKLETGLNPASWCAHNTAFFPQQLLTWLSLTRAEGRVQIEYLGTGKTTTPLFASAYSFHFWKAYMYLMVVLSALLLSTVFGDAAASLFSSRSCKLLCKYLHSPLYTVETSMGAKTRPDLN